MTSGKSHLLSVECDDGDGVVDDDEDDTEDNGGNENFDDDDRECQSGWDRNTSGDAAALTNLGRDKFPFPISQATPCSPYSIQLLPFRRVCSQCWPKGFAQFFPKATAIREAMVSLQAVCLFWFWITCAATETLPAASNSREQLRPLTKFRQQHRRTTDGRLCAAAFVQNRKAYTGCTDAPNPEGESGRPWCYVEAQVRFL